MPISTESCFAKFNAHQSYPLYGMYELWLLYVYIGNGQQGILSIIKIDYMYQRHGKGSCWKQAARDKRETGS